MELYDYIKKYTYRPFSDNWKQNSIDPRTYFYISKFLEEKKKEAIDKS